MRSHHLNIVRDRPYYSSVDPCQLLKVILQPNSRVYISKNLWQSTMAHSDSRIISSIIYAGLKVFETKLEESVFVPGLNPVCSGPLAHIAYMLVQCDRGLQFVAHFLCSGHQVIPVPYLL